jgi:hypothetical protein
VLNVLNLSLANREFLDEEREEEKEREKCQFLTYFEKN